MNWPPVSFEIPHRLRAIVRTRESSIIVLAALAGALAGLAVAIMGALVELMHVTLFRLVPGTRLSAQGGLDPLYVTGGWSACSVKRTLCAGLPMHRSASAGNCLANFRR